jgi:hypothetical protein
MVTMSKTWNNCKEYILYIVINMCSVHDLYRYHNSSNTIFDGLSEWQLKEFEHENCYFILLLIIKPISRSVTGHILVVNSNYKHNSFESMEI